jgi:hypothetical protein
MTDLESSLTGPRHLAWTGPVPLATYHAVGRWRMRVAPQLTLNGAHAELRSFMLRAFTVGEPPVWVIVERDATYLVCSSQPDICVPVRNGHALTVLVSWLASRHRPTMTMPASG